MTEQPTNPTSFIQIVFKEEGSTLFDANFSGVTPLQLLAIGEYIKIMGENMLKKANEQRERNKIQVPGVDDIIIP